MKKPEHKINVETQRIDAAVRTANDDAEAEEARKFNERVFDSRTPLPLVTRVEEFWAGWLRRLNQDLGALLADTIDVPVADDERTRNIVNMLIDIEQQTS